MELDAADCCCAGGGGCALVMFGRVCAATCFFLFAARCKLVRASSYVFKELCSADVQFVILNKRLLPTYDNESSMTRSVCRGTRAYVIVLHRVTYTMCVQAAALAPSVRSLAYEFAQASTMRTPPCVPCGSALLLQCTVPRAAALLKQSALRFLSQVAESAARCINSGHKYDSGASRAGARTLL